MIDAGMRRQHARTLQLEGLDADGFLVYTRTHFCVVGVGGLASGFLPLAAAMGARHFTIIDDDLVSPSNLPRQLLYTPSDVGMPKVVAAERQVRGYAPGIDARAVQTRLTPENAHGLVEGAQVLVDCSDNFATRYLLDRVAAELNLPLLYGAVGEALGHVTLLHGEAHVSLVDLFGPQPGAMPPPAVFPPAVHLVGTIMASEAFKWVARYGRTLDGVLLQVDLRTNACTRFEIAR